VLHMATLSLLRSAVLGVVMLGSSALAQSVPTTLRVETFAVPLFAVEQDGRWTGFSIELWEEIAGRLKTRSVYQAAPGVAAAFDTLRTGKADVLVSGFFMTAERDREVDFSHAIFQAGQQVMVRDDGATADPDPLMDLLQLLFSRTTLVWIGVAAVLLLVPAHIVWLLERRGKEGLIPPEEEFPGHFPAPHPPAGPPPGPA